MFNIFLTNLHILKQLHTFEPKYLTVNHFSSTFDYKLTAIMLQNILKIKKR